MDTKATMSEPDVNTESDKLIRILQSLIDTDMEDPAGRDVVAQLLRLPFNTFIADLGKFVDMEMLKKFAKFLGERVLRLYYSGGQYGLVSRRSKDLLCWDIYEFLLALENRKVSDNTTKRLKAQSTKVAEQDVDQLVERLELSDLNFKKLWDVVSTLVMCRTNDLKLVRKLKDDLESLKQNQPILDADYLDEDDNNNRRKQRKMSHRVEDAVSHSVNETPKTSRLVNENDGEGRRTLTVIPQVCVAGTESSKVRIEQQANSSKRMPQGNRQTPALKKGNCKTDDGGLRRVSNGEQQVNVRDQSKGHAVNKVSSYASVVQSSDGFQQAGGNRRRHKPTKIIRGQNVDAGDLTTSERRVHFCVSGVAPSMADEQVKAYVIGKIGVKVVEVELIKNRYERYVTHKMFRVTVGASDVDKMTNPELWHQNLSVRRYRMIPPKTGVVLDDATSNGSSNVTQRYAK